MNDTKFTPMGEIIRKKRDEYILRAASRGIPQEIIAGIFNVTQQRISQLIKDKENKK